MAWEGLGARWGPFTLKTHSLQFWEVIVSVNLRLSPLILSPSFFLCLLLPVSWEISSGLSFQPLLNFYSSSF